MPELAFKFAAAPLQIAVGPVILATALPAVTTKGVDVALQPGPLLTVTVNVPATLTVILCVVAPVLHKYDDPVLAVSVVLLPVQNELLPEIFATGGAATTQLVLDTNHKHTI